MEDIRHFKTYSILIFQVQSFKGLVLESMILWLVLQSQLGYDSILKGSIYISSKLLA